MSYAVVLTLAAAGEVVVACAVWYLVGRRAGFIQQWRK